MKIALVYYGASMKMKDLDRIEPLLIERFLQATNGAVGVEIISKEVIGFNKKMPAEEKKSPLRTQEKEQIGKGISYELKYKNQLSL